MPTNQTGKGILLYTSAFFFLSTMEVLAKLLMQDLHVTQAVWARYAGQTVIVVVWLSPSLKQVARTRYPGLQFTRSLLLLTGTAVFFTALQFLGLAEASAVMNVNPVLITLGAALFLGERFGIKRGLGVGMALIGALIVIRPGTDVFSPALLLPLISASCYAGFILLTRKVGHDEDPRTSLFYAALLGTLITTAVVPFFWQAPEPRHIAIMVAIGIVGAAGQFLMIQSVRYAEASAIAPFSYVALLIAAFWGYVVFGDVPDAATWIGGAIIVASGLYIWRRERQAIAPIR
ncbi:MAG: DMT family transporter [Pseudomonadota bacterium]|nr:DMT family transporter [Pseudomonadota bacterium]